MKFRVEGVFEIQEVVHVMARQLEAGGFEIVDSSVLGGALIRRWLDQPRKLLPDGTPDLEVFVFALTHRVDAEKFSVGQVVELADA